MRDADENLCKVTPPRPQPEPGVAFFLPRPIADVVARLSHESAGVRRIAAMDLGRLPMSGEAAGAAGDVLAQAAASEPDETTQVCLIRVLGQLGQDRHRPGLAALRTRTQSPLVAHAALLAHDSIEVRARRGPELGD